MTRGRALVLALPWAWVSVLLLAPLGIVLAIALGEPADGVPPFVLGLHLDNFVTVIADPLYRAALPASVMMAGITTLACLLLGYPMALAIARAPERWRAALLLAVMLPFWTGFLMRLNAWIALLRDDGWIAGALAWLGFGPVPLLHTGTAMYIGLVYTYLPFMVLPLHARLTWLDPITREAAADLGAAPWRVFAHVTLPLSLPGVWAGAALVFIPALGEYVVPELLGPPGARLIGRVVWEEFFQNRDWPMAAALTWVLLLALLVIPAALFRRLRWPM